ncbi:TetR/AcrR family transcriptional regulator [Zavarzinia sp.]|uniref:TetR/AcrR family transcriptional regulator n=1 Tax=Zavarzinia sp. TaxID=2027920 RepID=UPI0035665C07
MAEAVDLSMKKRPTQGRSQATVDAVLTAAAQLLGERGYGALTTNHIAERAGVSIGSVYQYFPGKEAIVAKLVERAVDEILAEFGAGLLGVQADFRRAAEVLYDTIDRRAPLVRAIQYEIPFLRDLPAVATLRERLLVLAGQIYAQSIGRNAFSRPNVAAFQLTAMIQSAVLESILAPLPGMTRADAIETLAEIIARLAGDGLREGAQAPI